MASASPREQTYPFLHLGGSDFIPRGHVSQNAEVEGRPALRGAWLRGWGEGAAGWRCEHVHADLPAVVPCNPQEQKEGQASLHT